MNVIVYGRSGCSYCIKAFDLCNSLRVSNSGFTWDYVNCPAENISKEDLSKIVNKPVNTYPQIIVDNKHIGGYTDFLDYIKRLASEGKVKYYSGMSNPKPKFY